jgi:hypothetical protein
MRTSTTTLDTQKGSDPPTDLIEHRNRMKESLQTECHTTEKPRQGGMHMRKEGTVETEKAVTAALKKLKTGEEDTRGTDPTSRRRCERKPAVQDGPLVNRNPTVQEQMLDLGVETRTVAQTAELES